MTCCVVSEQRTVLEAAIKLASAGEGLRKAGDILPVASARTGVQKKRNNVTEMKTSPSFTWTLPQ